MLSTDARLGVVVGKTLWSVWTPYVTGRAFGGPVFWRLDGEAVTGEDQHHYQLGVGSVVTFPVGIDLAIEWAPLGARGLTAGAGFAF